MLARTSLLVAAFAALASTAAIACSAAAPTESASGSEDHLSSDARKGAEFVRCWTTSDGTADEFFRAYKVTCHVTAAGLPGAGTSVYVDVETAQHSRQVSGSPGDSPDQDVTLGIVRKNDFPLTLHVYGTWASSPHQSMSAYRIALPAAEAATASVPVIVKMPFDTWPITFLNKLPVAIVTSHPYDVQAAPFKTSQDENDNRTTFSTSLSTGVLRGTNGKVDAIVPPSGSLHVQVQGPRTPYSADITSAGVYVIEESGLRLATAAEEAAANAGASDAGGGAPDAAPTPDAAPATTCGGPGQMHCTTGGNWSCLAGTRADLDSGLCVACGMNQQTYCVVDPRNVRGNFRCNDGTRWDAPTNLCVTCGAAGQTHCFMDPNGNNYSGNYKCNAGLHYDSNGICVM